MYARVECEGKKETPGTRMARTQQHGDRGGRYVRGVQGRGAGRNEGTYTGHEFASTRLACARLSESPGYRSAGQQWAPGKNKRTSGGRQRNAGAGGWQAGMLWRESWGELCGEAMRALGACARRTETRLLQNLQGRPRQNLPRNCGEGLGSVKT